MKDTFQFIISSLQNLLDDEFYIFCLCLMAFMVLLRIIGEMRGGVNK